MKIKTSRKDVETDTQPTKLIYGKCTLLGFSRLTLEPGDCFLYEESYTDGTNGIRLGMCRGRVKPNGEKHYQILTQTADRTMRFTYERWVLPNEVIETIPAERVKPGIKEFFDKQLEINGY